MPPAAANCHDAEDAFQATCLVLVRKAASIRPREMVGNWLYGVAQQTALNARAMLAKRLAREKQVGVMPEPAMRRASVCSEVQAQLDQELSRLPDKYRVAIVLCDLEGRSRKETARHLGLPEGTLAGHLTRGRALLAKRLARHGVALSAAALVELLTQQAASATVPASVLHAALKTTAAVVSGNAAAGGAISSTVLTLAEAATRTLLLKMLLHTTAVIVVALALALGVYGLAAHAQVDDPAPQDNPKAADAKVSGQRRAVDMHGDSLPAGALARLGTVRLRHGHGISGATYSADGKSIIVSDHYSDMHVWDAADGKQTANFFEDDYYCHRLALAPDGRTLAVAHGNLTVSLCDPKSGRKIGALPAQENRLGFLVFSPDSSLLATGCEKKVRIWQVATQRLLHTVAFDEGVSHVAFSSDGKVIACGTWDGCCRLWDLARKQEVRKLKAGPIGAHALFAVYAPGGGPLAVWGYEDRSIRLFDANGIKEMRRFPADDPTLKSDNPYGWVVCIYARFSPDGKTLAVFRDAGRIELWDVDNGKRVRTLPCDPSHKPSFLAFSPDGTKLATAGGDLWEGDNAVRLWDLAKGQEILRLAGHGAPITSVAMTPDGKTIATTGEDGFIHLWETRSGKHLHRLEASRGRLAQVSFTNDGQRLMGWGTWDADRTLRIWDARSYQTVRQMKLPNSDDYWTAVSADGKTAVSVDLKAGLARFHDLDTGKADRVFPETGHSRPTGFSPAGDTVVCHDGTLRSGADYKVLLRIGRLYYPNPCVRFSADGRLLIAAVVAKGPFGDFDARNDPPADEIVVIDPLRRKELRRFGMASADGEFVPLDAAALSADGKMVVAVYGGRYENQPRITLWETETGRQRGGFVGHIGKVNTVAVTADSRFIVTGSSDTTALVWDAANPQTRSAAIRPRSADTDPAACFKDLAGDDAEQAYASTGALIRAPAKTVSFLADQRSLFTRTDVAVIGRWIKQLDSEDFEERERAYQELRSILDEAEVHLNDALRGPIASLEMRRRIERLLQERTAVLHKLRVIEVLERIATPSQDAKPGTDDTRAAAVVLLERLAAGAPAARTTQEARASLERLRI